MTKIFNLNAQNYINLNTVVSLVIYFATNGLVSATTHNAPNCDIHNFDKAFETAIAAVKAELLNKGIITKAQAKALDTAAFHVSCAVYNAVCETTEDKMNEYFARETQRTLGKYTRKTKVAAEKLAVVCTLGFDKAGINLVEVVSYAVALATEDRVYNKPMVNHLIQKNGLRAVCTELNNINDQYNKVVDKVSASLLRKEQISEVEADKIQVIAKILLSSAKRAYDKYLKSNNSIQGRDFFADLVMIDIRDNMALIGEAAFIKASEPYNFKDFADYY